jgi:hypothetical protein
MEKKELRTVKKSADTGRLSREAVRSAVITVRDGRGPGTSKGQSSAASPKR